MNNLMERQSHASESCITALAVMQTRSSQYKTMEQPFGAISVNEVSTYRQATEGSFDDKCKRTK